MRLLIAATVAVAAVSVAAAQTRPAQKTPAPRRPTTPAPAPRAVPRTQAAVPFPVGETLTYDVSWSQFVTAGTAVARVVEKRSSYGSTAYYVVADGRPIPLVARFYPVYYKMDSLVDSFDLLSHWTSQYSEERGKKRETSMRFDRGARRAFYEAQVDPAFKEDFEVPPDTQDGLATLYSIRGRIFKAGERFTIPVADDGTMYSVEFETSGPEHVYVPFGAVDAWHLKITVLDPEKQPAARNTSAWISTDTRRLPVKLQSDLPIGSFVLALRERQP